jgi:hypothetical protein
VGFTTQFSRSTVTTWGYLGYHRIGGLVSGTNGYAGHFMSPSSQHIDPQTGRPGLYFWDNYHNGMDVMANYGIPVYTISSGIVKQISTGGWTKGGTTNVGVVIAHFTNTGQEFWVVYGHIEASTLRFRPEFKSEKSELGRTVTICILVFISEMHPCPTTLPLRRRIRTAMG